MKQEPIRTGSGMQDCVAILKEILGLSASASSAESWLVGFIEELCDGCDAVELELSIRIAHMTKSLLKNRDVQAWADTPDNRRIFSEEVRRGVLEGKDGKTMLKMLKLRMQKPAEERKAAASQKKAEGKW